MNDIRDGPIELGVKKGIGKDEITQLIRGEGGEMGKFLATGADMIIGILTKNYGVTPRTSLKQDKGGPLTIIKTNKNLKIKRKRELNKKIIIGNKENKNRIIIASGYVNGKNG